MNGYTKVPNKLIESKKLSFTEKILLIYLLRRRQNNTTCFPSYDRIASDIGFSRSTAIRMVNSLIEKGFLEKERNAYRSNIYTIRIKED